MTTTPIKERIEKEFPFRIEDGILEVWEQVLPDGDWEGRTTTIEELKSFILSFLTKEYDRGYNEGYEKAKEVFNVQKEDSSSTEA